MVTVSNLSIWFGSRALFSGITFFVGQRDRIGLVGKNGSGKSTMLKTFAGLQKPNEGNVAMQKGTTVGYLPQEMAHNNASTVLEEASSAFAEVKMLKDKVDRLMDEISHTTDFTSDAYGHKIDQLEEASHRLDLIGSGSVEEKIEKVLKGLGFQSTDMHRPLAEFSGGWKMRVELGKILLQNPDLLLLDEPTNHLDIESIEWLEDFLKEYAGAVVLISHDRTFLDNVTNRTIEISKGRIYDYKFSYTKYIVARQDEIEKQIAAAKNQQKYIEDTQKLIDKFRAKKDKAAFAQGLIKKLERLEKIEVDDFEANKVHIRFPQAPSAGKVIMTGKDMGKAYGQLRLFSGLEMMINRGEKIALVGKNGVGKSTLVRMMVKQEQFEGTLEPGHNVAIGYYAQNQSDTLEMDKTVFETIDDEATGDMRKNIRALLGAFLFSGDDVDKKVKVLSGGEKARLAFCKLMLQPYNFLVLDEPTNHLDLVSKGVLKEALKRYDGTMLVVSHDRDFLHGLTDIVYEIKADRLRIWNGDVLDFLKEKKAQSIALFEQTKSDKKADALKQAEAAKPAATQTTHENHLQKKETEKQKKKLQTFIQKSEKEIEVTEAALEQLNLQIASMDYSDKMTTEKTLTLFTDTKTKLEELMRQWEQAQKELEGLG